MFAPRTVQQPTLEQAPVQTRQAAKDPTHGLTTPEHVRGTMAFMQRYLGNSALQSLNTENKAPQEAAVPLVVHDGPSAPYGQQASEVQTKSTTDQTAGPGLATVSQGTVEIDGAPLTTYADAAAWYQWRIMYLSSQQTEMSRERVPAPVSVQSVIDTGKQNAAMCAAGGQEPIDDVTAEQARSWFEQYYKVKNEAEAEQAKVASKRAKELADEIEEEYARLARVSSWLRDQQRESFRNNQESALLKEADFYATLVDCGLITKDAILTIQAYAAGLENWANAAKGYKGVYPPAQLMVPVILECIEKANRVYAGFQLVRAGVDLLSSKKTTSDRATAGVKAMAVLVSAGGTLLSASASMTLYANIYIGPLVDGCMEILDKLKNDRSRGPNRTLIQLGKFDVVNWSIEQGDRPVFDFMLAVMRAENVKGVPATVPKVASFFLDHKDALTAGVGGKDRLPTTGLIFEKLDESKIASWAFLNRKNLWGMLYGDCEVPA